MSQFLMIPNSIIRNTEYSKWSGTAEYRVWQYLTSYIVRRPNGGDFTKFLYDKYHCHNMLVARWNQKDIATNLGLRSAGHISDLIKSMDEKGIIRKHYEPWNRKSLCVYELGRYDRENNRDIYYAFNYFIKKKAEHMLVDFGISEMVNFGFSETIIE